MTIADVTQGDEIQRLKEVMVQLDDLARDPTQSGGTTNNLQGQTLGAIGAYEGDWWALVDSAGLMLDPNRVFDPENPSPEDQKDPKGYYDLVQKDDETTVPPSNDRLTLGCRFTIDRIVKFTALWIGIWEGQTEPPDAANFFEQVKEQQRLRGKERANSVYSQVPPNGNGQARGRGNPNPVR